MKLIGALGFSWTSMSNAKSPNFLVNECEWKASIESKCNYVKDTYKLDWFERDWSRSPSFGEVVCFCKVVAASVFCVWVMGVFG